MAIKPVGEIDGDGSASNPISLLSDYGLLRNN